MDLKPNSLAIKAPGLRSEWSSENTVNFDDVSYGSQVKRKWICPQTHKYSASPHARTAKRPHGCPECSGRKVSDLNSIAAKAPHLVIEWHLDNDKTPREVAYMSSVLRKWRCKSDSMHEWWATPGNRTSNNHGCPFCSRRRVSAINSLATKAPHLEREWHSDNKEKFCDISCGSKKKYCWVCSLGHVWRASPHNRTKRKPSRCPECTGYRVSKLNSLASRAPHLLAEWHPDNNKSFDEVFYSSAKKYKWICRFGHVWEAKPCHRTDPKHPSGCPECIVTHSKAETAIFDAIRVKYPDAVNGQRGLLRHGRSELDIHIPSLKKAIEYDGTYWHSRPGSQERDLRKDQQCAEVGIQLLRIPEAEYESDREGTIVKVLAWLGSNL